MPENNFSLFPELNKLIVGLWNEDNKRKALDLGIEIANELMHILGIGKDELLSGEDALNEAFPNSKFKNQKMEKWYEKHPFFGGARVALYHYKKGTRPVESYFYWLNESATKARISATTQLFANWEDSKLTMKPEYNVGIDFFLSGNAKSLLMVITNEGNLRVLEFSESLSNTQIEILNHIQGCALYDGIDPVTGQNIPFEPQRTIHKTLWNALELSEVNKQFYSGIADQFTLLCQHLLENRPDGISESVMKEGRKIFSSRLIGRLLFLWFLRKKGIINDDYNYFDLENMDSSEYYERKLKILFFSTLNTPINKRLVNDKKTPYLNGGLFDAHENDWANKKITFPNGWFENLYAHLNKFNFTTDESSPEYEQVAIDPEMLGRVFENLLASIVPETSDAANERKNKGAFYTPREIVSFMCKESLRTYLKSYTKNEKDFLGIDRLIDMNDSDFLMDKSTGVSELWGTRSEVVKEKLIEGINEIKILDPACGSGAFPIGLMQLIIKTLDRLTAFYDDEIGKFRLGKPNEKNDIYKTKLFIIRKMLYGSDLEPMAIEISKLRAWLSLIVDNLGDIEPLPNLDFNFVCANSLIHLSGSKDTYQQMNIFNEDTFEDDFKALRDKYFNAHSFVEKNALRTKFDDIFQTQLSEAGNTLRARQLKSWNPFLCNKPSDFFDSKFMFDIEGFDIVIGNPPYIHFEDMKDVSKNLYKPMRYYQSYEARGDIYTLFYEMGLQNLKPNGTLCYITSNKWMRAGYGQSLRDKVFYHYQVDSLIDLGSGVFESATVDTNIIIVRNSKYISPTKAVTLSHDVSKTNMSDYIKQNYVDIKFKLGEPWVVLSSIEQSIKSKLEKYGIPLSEWPDIKINYGIKTGLNEAFIVDEKKREQILNSCKTPEERELTDKLIRPILRGRDIKRNSYEWAHYYIILAYFDSHKFIPTKCPSIYNHLKRLENDLKNRGQCKYLSSGKTRNVNDNDYPGYKGMHHWLELDNCPSKKYLDLFDNPIIAWQRITQSNNFCLTEKNMLVLDSMAFLTAKKELMPSLQYLLCSQLFYYWMRKNVHEYGESGFRLSNQFVAIFPAIMEKVSTEEEMYNFYHLTEEEINIIKTAK